MEVFIGQLTIKGGGGDSGRVRIVFEDNDRHRGLIYDPSYEEDKRIVTISDDWQVGEPGPIGLTLTKEKACEILTHVLERQKFPNGLRWAAGDLSEYEDLTYSFPDRRDTHHEGQSDYHHRRVIGIGAELARQLAQWARVLHSAR
jgi:hypothetical protein